MYNFFAAKHTTDADRNTANAQAAQTAKAYSQDKTTDRLTAMLAARRAQYYANATTAESAADEQAA